MCIHAVRIHAPMCMSVNLSFTLHEIEFLLRM